MAGNATIGALRVDLGLNSAQFVSGLKKAGVETASFSKSATLSLAAVATAAIAVATAMGVAIKGSIDHADALYKAGQKTGLTTEALSRLEYAARLSDVSLEELTGSLGKLSKSMIAASQDAQGQTARAFAALGISVKDSAGNIKGTDEVFNELADRFSKLPDSATKTALAIAILGKSGAQMIPLLNGGSAALKRLADESDRVGKTISTETGKAAEDFNDDLTRVSAAMQGLVDKIMVAVLPGLKSMAEWLTTVDPKTIAVAAGIVTLTGAVTIAAPAVGTLTKAMSLLYAQLALIAALPAGVLALAGGIFLASTEQLGDDTGILKRYKASHGAKNFSGAKANDTDGFASPANDNSGGIDLSKFTDDPSSSNAFKKLIANTDKRIEQLQAERNAMDLVGVAADSLRNYHDLLSEAEAQGVKITPEITAKLHEEADAMANLQEQIAGAQMDLADLSPWDAMGKAVDDLNQKVRDGAITWRTYAVEQAKAAEKMVDAYGDAANNVLDSIGNLADAMGAQGKDAFEIHKDLSIAKAVVSGGEAIVHSYASGTEVGGPVVGAIFAGIAAVATAAQIAQIASTTYDSSQAIGASGSGGAQGGAAAGSQASAPSAPNVTVQLVGGGRYSRDEVLGLMKDINSALGDGAKFNIAA